MPSAKTDGIFKNMQTINDALNKLSKSKFRSRFKLSKKDVAYINEKGIEKIREHAYDFIKKISLYTLKQNRFIRT